MKREVYCEIVGKAAGFFKNKVEIEVDFGQEKSWFGGRNPLSDSSGKVLKFNSMIDALNHMAEDDWSFVNAYAITVKEQNIYHYLMKKTVEE